MSVATFGGELRVVTPVVSALLMAVAGRTASGQDVRVWRMSDESPCDRCQITWRVEGEFTGGDLERLAGVFPFVRVDALNRYWLLGAGAPQVFDSLGRFVGRVDGRAFDLRFASVWDAVPIDRDSTLLLDSGDGKAAMVNGDLRVVRAVLYPSTLTRGVVLRWPDRVVLTGDMATPDDIGWPLHLVSFRGDTSTMLKSFGPDSGRLLYGQMGAHNQAIVSIGASVWTADAGKYRLTQWDSIGHMMSKMALPSVGLRWSEALSLGNSQTPPSAAVTDLTVDSRNRAWVFISVPSARWKEAWSSVPPGAMEVPARSIKSDLLLASRVEVVDTRSATVIAKRTLSDRVLGLGKDGQVVVLTRDDGGKLHLKLYRLSLTAE